ncbi:hypothetical protein BpHYR1_012014 [Brachionus plicatilis]|uniref:Uncharacterized protein n=1 Tax=Brachionus plicatilis TaxID=10195 RepID=A0A3M7SIQ4_BRAPC|nr:hypothetical protein BpHYR1_012014 [Brachionus plicatilis]
MDNNINNLSTRRCDKISKEKYSRKVKTNTLEVIRLCPVPVHQSDIYDCPWTIVREGHMILGREKSGTFLRRRHHQKLTYSKNSPNDTCLGQMS